MRKPVLFWALTLVVGASPSLAAAQSRAVVPAAPVAAPAAASAQAAGNEAQLESLRQRLLASQQTIATLERELAEEKNRTIALERCRVKNGRLVGIGRQLVEEYQQRWRATHKDPFQFGRRRFEFEMQSLSEAVYEENVDVTPEPAPAAETAGEAPTESPTAPATQTPQTAGN